MIRTRTIKEAAAFFRENDPQTCLTETAIRTLLRTGKVPCARIGKKYLVTIEALEDYLRSGVDRSAEQSGNNAGRQWQIK